MILARNAIIRVKALKIAKYNKKKQEKDIFHKTVFEEKGSIIDS